MCHIPRRAFIASLAAWPFCSQARPAAQAPALLLAQQAPASIDPAGWLVSEKLDGVRAFWDGQQLRFRSGATIAAPAWFTKRLPALPLDGELWLGRGSFQALSGIVRRAAPDSAGWQALRYMLFELPGGEGGFAARAARLRELARDSGWAQLAAVEQSRLPSAQALQQRLATTVAAGGEGLMLHRADAPYHSGRSPGAVETEAAAGCGGAGHRPCGRPRQTRGPPGRTARAQRGRHRIPARYRLQRRRARSASRRRAAGSRSATEA